MRNIILFQLIFSLIFSVFGDTRVGAICNDGTVSNETGSGACSGHGGVNLWLVKDVETYDTISICSFNIQFLGLFKLKNAEALSTIVKDYDIVIVQELVAPPYDGTYPDGEQYNSDPEARRFFDAMHTIGFESILSEEDTGTRDAIHKGSSATEWFCAFFNPDIVQVAEDLPNCFLADDRSNHPDYERVPYAFSFRSNNGNLDFVLISVHLQPGGFMN